MIESHQVRRVADDFLREALMIKQPGAYGRLVNSNRFGRFVELCTLRCKQLDVEGFITGKRAFEYFVKQATKEWGKRELGRVI